MSQLFTNDTIDSDFIEAFIVKYPELNDSLQLQLHFYKEQFKPKTLNQVRKDFIDMIGPKLDPCSSKFSIFWDYAWIISSFVLRSRALIQHPQATKK